jgi:hypothetical protein
LRQLDLDAHALAAAKPQVRSGPRLEPATQGWRRADLGLRIIKTDRP